MSSTSAPTISRFPVPELADAPEDLRTFIQDVADKTGFVPNILALLHRPEECRAFIAYYTAVMDRRGGLTPAEKEMIIVATSAAWDCPYCVVAWTTERRELAPEPRTVDGRLRCAGRNARGERRRTASDVPAQCETRVGVHGTSTSVHVAAAAVGAVEQLERMVVAVAREVAARNPGCGTEI